MAIALRSRGASASGRYTNRLEADAPQNNILATAIEDGPANK